MVPDVGIQNNLKHEHLQNENPFCSSGSAQSVGKILTIMGKKPPSSLPLFGSIFDYLFIDQTNTNITYIYLIIFPLGAVGSPCCYPPLVVLLVDFMAFFIGMLSKGKVLERASVKMKL